MSKEKLNDISVHIALDSQSLNSKEHKDQYENLLAEFQRKKINTIFKNNAKKSEAPKINLVIGNSKPLNLTRDDWTIYVGQNLSGKKYNRNRTYTLPMESLEGVTSLIDLIKGPLRFKQRELAYKKTFEYEKRTFQRSLTFLKSLNERKSENGDLTKLIEKFLNVHLFLNEVHQKSSSFENVYELVSQMNRSGKNLEEWKVLKVVSNKEYLEKFRTQKEVIGFCIDDNDGLFLVLQEEGASDYYCYLLSEVLLSIESFHIQRQRFESIQEVGSLWGGAFQSIPTPVALFTSDGELILHNSMFSNLSILPKDCLKLENDQTIERKDKVFKVHKRILDFGEEEVFYFTFNSFEQSTPSKGAGASSQELGIISSSIAHELNNPIAGILAALSYIELDENLDSEQLESLGQMKEGAMRCRDLIRIFLGFSRARPQEGFENKNEKHVTLESFKKALDLLRFRMIESELRFDIEYNIDLKSFDSRLNESIISMIFYLLLGDVLTCFSHHRLIDEVGSRSVRASYSEKNNSIEFFIHNDIDLKLSKGHSKLLNHLAQIEGLDFEIESNAFKLFKDPSERMI